MREGSLFEMDFMAHLDEIRKSVKGARILVIGGAGSIGSATVKELTGFSPGALHVVDVSENNLAELVRDLRGSPGHLDIRDFQTLPLDYGSPIFRRFLQDHKPYDIVLNFAAIKHVRSEKDLSSLLQMLDTNVVKQALLLRWLSNEGGVHRYFSVSTDKAANPVNLMGATKRAMEHVIFSAAGGPAGIRCVTSARFANVAFSDGSLLHGWQQRLAKRQPIAVPMATRRYFISLREAGQICVLAALCGENGRIVIPKLDERRDLRDLADVAREYLAAEGFRAREYEEETLAKSRVQEDIKDGHYPLLLTPLDTDGEKPFEEFIGEGEITEDIGMIFLRAVRYVAAPPDVLANFLEMAKAAVSNPYSQTSKEDIIAALKTVIPQFRHRATGKSLDARL